MSEKRVRKSPAASIQSEVNKRKKSEWIESAWPVFKAERFEMAGALFDCEANAELTKQEVKQKLDAYLHPKEDKNVNSTD
ncbi:hypothetical protein AM501_15110 [Aneurinibacillus migulanus]|uniref:YqzN/YkzM domain-containing protein n=1 Tax=Aneurinibacillus migulanus TaxID=47500 RepID=A0A0M0GTH3_ANEMI|nr:hypothetical protein [Aneurinibacillus migulanus]KON93139.1 hypothetical protein AF333_26100 [Aneurinibacillus migulanus]KPD07563.1 hypothetical protein AM501_15110 [Aneurinibacillus migulanus]MCP1357518.1 hypothetical protein [Aneurinibacillus migulanus]MED0890961.1 hypothetical protein [Aneurinibacillus migulanus]MED1614602.1 hypothetical protein [Aneurinibacillus migulanus]